MIKQNNTIINTETEYLQKRVEKTVVKHSRFTPDIKIPQFHWKRDKLDPRDYSYSWGPESVATVVDLRPLCSPVENQGNLGSCTGQAIAGAIEFLNNRNKKPTDVSRLYIYYYERLLEGTVNYDSGAYIRDGIKATNKFGAPLEKFWPYQANRFRVAPSLQARNDGARRKVTLYERASGFDSVVNAISNQYPVIVGFDVYSSFYNIGRDGRMAYPNISKERLLGGHAVLLVGYDNNKQCFIARNSWGANWGEKGYFYMPYDVIRNSDMSSDFWVIKSVLNP